MLTAGAIAAAVSGQLVAGDPGLPIGGFSIDTRTLVAGDLFFALRGERFDGHAFVGDAVHRGACGVVISDRAALASTAAGPGPVAIVSGDTIRALQALGQHVRRASQATVVAVTGSAGKSTTKEIAAELLSLRYRVFRNRGNLNNHIGLPLSLVELRRRPEIAVVEFGMNHAGEISTLVGIAEPQVRVWTNVGPAHLGFFGTLEAVAEAKAEILEKADGDHLLVANADDERVMARTARFAGRLMTFGIERPADVRASSVRSLGIDGLAATVRTPGGETEIRTALVGPGNLANLLAGTAVATHFGVPLADIAARAATLTAVTHRGEVMRLGSGVAVIDDSYNSNPAALASALAVLHAETRYARRVAVLGEMLELGEDADALHRACGRSAATSGLGLLVAVGGAPAEVLAQAAVAAGMSAGSVYHAATSAAASDLAVRLVRPGDLVLVKGSRGIRTEIVVERLKVEFA